MKKPAPKVLIAPNAFKGSWSSLELCQMIANAFSGKAAIEIDNMPIADGGDGILKIVMSKLGLVPVQADTVDPLRRPMTATYGINPDRSLAFIELAEASGLHLLHEQEYNTLAADTYGTGILVKNAVDQGVKTVYIGLGGSATLDIGLGIGQALGLVNGDIFGEFSLKSGFFSDDIRVIGLCDVTNPLTGRNGAARIYGQQKGLKSTDLPRVEKWISTVKADMEAVYGRMHKDHKYTGAAGGAAFGLRQMLNARLVSGSNWILSQLEADDRIRNCDWVITGEGRLDEQTLSDKGPWTLIKKAKKYNKKVCFITGSVHLPQLPPEIDQILAPGSGWVDQKSMDILINQFLDNISGSH